MPPFVAYCPIQQRGPRPNSSRSKIGCHWVTLFSGDIVCILRGILVLTTLITALPGNVTWAQENSGDQVIDRIVQRENEEVKTLRSYDPIIETYVQDIRPDQKPGTAPVTDHYFFGRAILSEGMVQRPSGGKKVKT